MTNTPPKRQPASELPPRDPNEQTCASCEGRGDVADGKKCATCEGRGWTLIKKPALPPAEGGAKSEKTDKDKGGPKK